jgi:hypothetical protein
MEIGYRAMLSLGDEPDSLDFAGILFAARDLAGTGWGREGRSC